MPQETTQPDRKQLMEAILRLASSIAVLDEAVRKDIEAQVPTMDLEALNQIYAMLLKLQKTHLEEMKRELEVRKEVAAHVAENRSDRAREARQTAENKTRLVDLAEAENLINNA